jgi:membrane associated rhomboid family serine protease
MAISSRDRSFGSSFSGVVPTGVRWLLIINVAVFLLNFLAARLGFDAFFGPLGLIPRQVIGSFAIWQLVTYMFLHSIYDFWHIIFNMLALWMFGSTLERDWGTRQFLKYYFLCGVGAGVCVVLANLAFGSLDTRTIGASGAIYGLLLAFGVLYPDAIILFAFLFPIKAKYFVMILGAIAFLSSTAAAGGSVSHVAHLGGMIFGFIYLKGNRLRLNPVQQWDNWYKEYKLRRAKKKFQVYLKKHGTGSDQPDRWVH